jgi:glycosyltransferase involved in cell wall biosynthesis
MRVLMLSDFYWPFLGGVEQHVRRLSHALTARGHEVAVATLGNGELPAFELDDRVRVYRLQSTTQRASWLFRRADRPWAPPFPDPEVTAGLRRVLRQETPDVVHGHDWLARAFLPLKLGHPAKFVISLHYYTLSCAKKSLMYHGQPCSGPGARKCLECATAHYGLPKGVAVVTSNWAFAAAERASVDMFLPVSRATAAANGLAEGPRVTVIPNFMPDLHRPSGDQSAYTSQLPREPFLLFVGDLRRDKGLEVLLAAYAGLPSAPPLVLIGKVWPETPAIWPANVRVLQNWPNEAVLAAWRRCLLGIVPSIWPEPFGIVVIEALAAGRPVIGSNIGGIPDILANGEAGVLVPPGDVLALRQSITDLLADTERRERLGRAAQRRAEAFEAAAVVPQIEQVYAGLLRQAYESHEPAVS